MLCRDSSYISSTYMRDNDVKFICMLIFFPFHIRSCGWLSDELKEEYRENARVIEKAILKAVRLSSFHTK